MRDGRSVDRIAAIGIGAHAASRLPGRAHARVLAVFAHGFHALFDGGLVLTVGHPSLGAGPSNLLVAGNALGTLGDVRPDDTVTAMRRGVLRVAGEAGDGPNDGSRTVVIDWTRAPRYRTPPQKPAPDATTLRTARTQLSALDGAPAEGFGWRLRAPSSHASSSPTTTVEATASPNRLRQAFRDTTRAALTALDDWLAHALLDDPFRRVDVRAQGAMPLHGAALAPVPPAVLSLLGAGPGLTPAGDDLLAGVLLALHRLRREDVAESLWRTLAPALDERTHPFSAAQLALAALGEHAAATTALLAAVFDVGKGGTDAHRASALRTRLDALGATSGWDLAAGIATVLDTRLAADERSAFASPPVDRADTSRASPNVPSSAGRRTETS